MGKRRRRSHRVYQWKWQLAADQRREAWAVAFWTRRAEKRPTAHNIERQAAAMSRYLKLLRPVVMSTGEIRVEK